MPVFIAKVMLQDVTKEDIYSELDKAMADEEGYPYITDADERIFALPPDEYEFDTDLNANQLLQIIKNICANIEKKHKLKKTPIVVVEAKNIQYANLEELHDEDFAD
ncbi:MAG: hypothetical protein NDI63_06015 [Pseudobdellovibrio sp.]|nr:hypothetical protein [Pseudobdellovibrio sp.]